MNNINGVDGSSSINVVDSAELSQQDFISAVYLERGNMLDSEVRRIAKEIETSNELMKSVSSMIGKSNVSQYGTTEYDAPTWTVNNNNIILDNGYGLAVQSDGADGVTFTLLDAAGNQLIYQNQTLIPVPAGSTVDVMQSGIPVMNDMTLILDDGTEITFQTDEPETPFNPQDLSGGLADIATISISRGNQGMTVTGVNSGNPSLNPATLDGENLDVGSNDGYVLLESGGLHSWEYDGAKLGSLTQTDPNDSEQEISGYFARKAEFQAEFNNEVSGGLPVLTQEEMNILNNLLKINFQDASGAGMLTPEEWAALKESLEAARENLTGSNQLQTVQLQRALTTHNQNYDVMSNSQNKIYSLLKDIINNVK